MITIGTELGLRIKFILDSSVVLVAFEIVGVDMELDF